MQSDLMLRDVPNDAWQNEWDGLMADPWLSRKLDRDRRLREHIAYLEEHVPDVLDQESEPGLVVDIGPGAGETLDICRVLGHDILGIDAENGRGGMGDKYLRASQLMCQRQGIPVRYCGLMALAEDFDESLRGQCVLVNSRGSIEQALSDFMDGPPHDEHHDRSQLRWRNDERTYYAFHRVFSAFYRLLHPGGILLIHANGSHPDTQDWYHAMVLEVALDQGFGAPEKCSDNHRLHLWRKRGVA